MTGTHIPGGGVKEYYQHEEKLKLVSAAGAKALCIFPVRKFLFESSSY